MIGWLKQHNFHFFEMRVAFLVTKHFNYLLMIRTRPKAMKYRLQLLLCLLSISFTHAQDLENSLLWKISGNGLEQSSYLFGTIHITCDATLEDKVKKALDETTHLVLELDADDPSLQTKMLTGMYMKDGKTLKDYTTEKEYAKIDSLFKERMGFSVEMINNVKPEATTE